MLAFSDETALAERPQGLRVLRVFAAAALGLALVAGAAKAAAPVAAPASDPGAAGTDLVWQEPGVGGILLRGGAQTRLPGSDPAIGDTLIAWHSGSAVTVAARDTLQPVLQMTVPGLEKLAVSQAWLAYLLSPARIGGTLLYVRLGRCSQQLRIGRLDGNGAGRVLYKLPPLAGQDLGHEHGHPEQGSHVPCPGRPKPTARSLWTTALSGTTAYVTVLRASSGGHLTPSLLAVPLAK